MVTVNNDSELTTQLNAATGGEVIELAAGVNFGRYNTPGSKTYTTPVTIQSLDNQNRGSFEKLQVNSGNVILKDFNINYVYRSGDFTFTPALLTFNSPNVTVDGLRIVGNQTDGGGLITGWAADFQGLGTPSDNLTVRNAYVEGFDNGFRILIANNVTFENIEMEALAADGIDPTGVKTMTMRKIYAHDWQTPRPGAHIDFIQLLRHANTGGCEDILIDQCICDQGNGYFQQGVWGGIDGFDVSNSFNRHKRVTIQDTILITGHSNGVGVSGCDDLVMRRLMMLPGPFASRDTITGGIPVMNVSASNGPVIIEDSIYPGDAGGFPSGSTFTNNYIRTRADIGGSEILAPNVGDVNGFNDYQIASGALESGGRQAGPRIAQRVGGWVDAGIAPHAAYQALPAGFQGGVTLPVLPSGSVSASVTVG